MHIGVIVAMKKELGKFTEQIKFKTNLNNNSIALYDGVLYSEEPTRITTVLCGCGKVNAAAATATLLTVVKVDAVIVVGVSGAISDKLDIGDIVIGNSFIQYDLDARPISEQYTVPYEGSSFIFANIELKKHIHNILKTNIEKLSTGGKLPKLYEGMIITGDRFLSSDKDRSSIIDGLPKAMCVDMETAAIAYICQKHNIPLGVIRIVSDRADGKAQIDFETFIIQVAEVLCVKVLELLCNNLPKCVEKFKKDNKI